MAQTPRRSVRKQKSLPKGASGLLRDPSEERPESAVTSYDHRAEVHKVNSRIRELLEVLEPEGRPLQEEEEEGAVSPGATRRKGDEGGEKGRARGRGASSKSEARASGSESEDYDGLDPSEAAKLVRQKVAKAMKGLHTDEREEVLKEVGIWLHQRMGAAGREIAVLGGLEDECDDRVAEREAYLRSAVGGMKAHEADAAGAMRRFCGELGQVHEAHQARGKACGEKSKAPSENLEVLCAQAEKALAAKEKEAWKLLKEVKSQMFGHGQAGQPDTGGKVDVVAELEKQVAYLSGSQAAVEQEADRVRHAFDQLGGHGQTPEQFAMLQPEAAKMLEKLKEKEEASLLPGLLEERERAHGGAILPPDDTYLESLHRDCDILHKKIDSAQAIIDELKPEDTLSMEEDLQAQLRCLDEEGAMPKTSALQRCLDVLDPGAWDQFAKHEQDAGCSHQFQYILGLEAEVRKHAQAESGRVVRLLHKLLDARRHDQNLAGKLRKQEDQSATLRASIELLEDHKSLIAGAAKYMRSQAPAGERKPEGQGRVEGAPSAAVTAALAAVRGPNAPSKGAWEHSQWERPFQLDIEDDIFGDEAMQAQGEILAALRAEEKRVTVELMTLEATLEQRTSQICELTRQKLDDAEERAIGQLKEVAGAGRESVQALGKSLQKLSAVGNAEAAAASERLSDRHIAVERVRLEERKLGLQRRPESELQSEGAGSIVRTLLDAELPAGTSPVLQDIARAQERNERLAQQVQALEPQVEAARRRFAPGKRTGREVELAQQQWAARRGTRDLDTMRAEIRACAAYRTKLLGEGIALKAVPERRDSGARRPRDAELRRITFDPEALAREEAVRANFDLAQEAQRRASFAREVSFTFSHGPSGGPEQMRRRQTSGLSDVSLDADEEAKAWAKSIEEARRGRLGGPGRAAVPEEGEDVWSMDRQMFREVSPEDDEYLGETSPVYDGIGRRLEFAEAHEDDAPMMMRANTDAASSRGFDLEEDEGASLSRRDSRRDRDSLRGAQPMRLSVDAADPDDLRARLRRLEESK